MKHFIKHILPGHKYFSSLFCAKFLLFSIIFLEYSIIGVAQTAIGLDCNQPINTSTGAIQANTTMAVVGTTCTPWVRLNFILGPWSSPSDQTLHSGKTWKETYDEIVNGFINQGIQVYGLISDQACSNPGDVLKYDPSSNQAATDAWISQYVINFVDIVGYFRNRVTKYESFNEPNNWNNGTAVVHSKWFAKILQEIYLETKYNNGHDTDPSWQVTLMSGPIFTHAQDNGATYIGSTYSYGINDFDWTWIKNNKGTYPLDGIGMHIYTTQGDSDPSIVTFGMNTNINAFWNSIINYEGTTSKQIWVSEFGWESNAVGYQGQADNLTTGFNLLKNDSRIALATWFCLTDWPGASWGLYEFGNFSTTDQKLSFNAFKNQVNCQSNISPTNLQVSSDCSGNVNFSWINSGNGWFLDVSTDPGYSTFSNKDVSNLTSTTAPSGFSPAITFLPNTTYYWRIWNGSTHTDGNSFAIPSCISPTNLQGTPDCSGNVNFNWTNSGNGWFIDVSTDPTFSTFSNKDVSGLTSTTAPSGFSPAITFLPNTTYYWRMWNGSNHTDGNSFTISACPINLQVIADCSGNVNFNWTNSGNGWFVDVSADPTFSTFSNKDVSGLTSTTAPSGFSPSITFLPNTTYYWRIWNGATHTDGSSFTIPTCISPTNLQAIPDCSGNVNFNWTDSGNGWFVDVSTDPTFSTFSNIDVSNLTSITAPSGFSPAFTFLSNTTYYWRMWNGTTHTDGNSFTVPVCPADLQVFIGCSGDAGFNWTNSGTDWVVDISSDSNFSFYYNKNVSNQTTTTGPSGFVCDVAFAPCTPNTLSIFQPNTNYYWRIWNGYTHINGASFTVPTTLIAPTITSGGSTTFCQGGNVTLDAGAGYSSYSWSNGASTQTINVTSSDNFSVTVTDEIGCLAISVVTTVTVNPNPAAPSISAGGPTTFCQGGSVTLDAGAGYSNYSWSNGASSQTLTVTSTDNLSVTVTDGNGCLASSVVTTVTVNPNPAAPSISASGTTTFCEGGSVTLDAGSGYGTYSWSNGASSQTVIVTSTDNLSVTVTDGNGCLASSVITTVTVNQNPAAPSVTASGTTTFCEGGIVILDAGAGYNSYLWSNGTTSQTVNVTGSDNLSVIISDGNGCSATSSTVAVNVNPLPLMPVISQNGSILTSNNSTGNQWYLDTNTIVGATLQNYTPVQDGNYTLIVTDTNGCSATSAVFNFTITDIKNISATNGLKSEIIIFPNPGKGVFQLKINGNQIPIIGIEVFNVLGKRIYHNLVNDYQLPVSIDLSEQPHGIYFMQINTEEKKYYEKIIIH